MISIRIRSGRGEHRGLLENYVSFAPAFHLSSDMDSRVIKIEMPPEIESSAIERRK
jgi:hypothetical protein